MTVLRLERITSNSDETLGALYLNGKFRCFTLEDEHRTKKVYAETRIPEGTYDINLRNAGGMNVKYKKTFPGLHRGMLHLQRVPNFEWIYIHVGNSEDQTAGCILVGQYPRLISDHWTILNSRKAYADLYEEIVSKDVWDVSIEITNRDL